MQFDQQLLWSYTLHAIGFVCVCVCVCVCGVFVCMVCLCACIIILKTGLVTIVKMSSGGTPWH